jgi:mannose-1-phosphate guanylyltransferase
MLHAIIMAGGAGTRFWPASRTARPKQLLDLVGGRTMIQATVDRLNELVPAERVLVVTNQQLVEPIREQLPQLSTTAVVGEPCKRDTAPCIGLAAALVRHQDPDATMVVMPADHVIPTVDVFQAAIAHAAALVDENPHRIVTFGIRPTYPAESFGYIKRGPDAERTACEGPTTYPVEEFREKPSRAVAERYVASGRFYWNSGIFVWKAERILSALDRFEPAMAAHLHQIEQAIGSPQFEEVLQREFTAIAGKSIDYAVMERADDVLVVEAPFAWDDVGSWNSLPRTHGADKDGNTIIGRHLGLRTTDSIVRTDDQHLIVTLGLKDCIIVHTPDATLVANKHDEEAVREAVKLLEEREWREYL